MFYTREQVERLEKYRKTFETAIKSGFARNVGSVALKDIESIYDEAYGSHYSYNSGCSVCVLGFIKRVGEPFLKESKIYEAEKRVQEAAEAEEEEKEVFLPDVEVKDGIITFNFERALASEAAIKAKAEQETNTNDSPQPKTNKRTRKKKEDGNK